MKLCFATNNPNKLREINELLDDIVDVVGLADIGCTKELPETGDTLEDNSKEKASYVFEHFNISCFADDTGLEVEALNGAPGVYSARYAGEPSNSQNNMNLLLKELEGKKNRKARFRTVITLLLNGESYQFEGIVEGEILNEKSGSEGFGYDPIFQPLGYNTSFAEMTSTQKNKISHRGRAVRKLVEYLKENKHLLS